MAHDACGVGCSSGSTKRWKKYDVFLSFRGEDTRTNFTDHLYAALVNKGLKTFRDEEGLERGQSIKPSLLQAIEESLCAIVVLSPSYASSTWCLDELQEIIRLKEESKIQVFPIFYGVDPSDIKKQKGNFAEAFKDHEERFPQDKMKVQGWRKALEKVATISGWHSQNRHETEFIESISKEMMSMLPDKSPQYHDTLIGIEPKLDDLESIVPNEQEGTQFIGIWGTGGLGKTTLAIAFYEKNLNNFEVHCFLHNVREVSKTDGLILLQRKLLSALQKGRCMDVGDYYEGRKLIRKMSCNRKVLLVLDDVSETSQLENLAGRQGWFGEGSIIIITTRDKHVLTSYDVSTQYDMKFLNDDESLELFHQNAFNGNKTPNKDYLELSRTVIHYAGGLPLVLKVLGSYLCGRNVSVWKDAMAKFKKVPHNDVLKILQVSFDGLDDDEKTIFLDIACFFNGKRRDYVIQMLHYLDLHPIVGIEVLIDKSLVMDDNGTLWVHDMLQEMGKSIGKTSRIWSLDDANYVLNRNEGIEVVRGIVLRLDQENVSYWDPKAFSRMSNLKLLMITSSDPHCCLNLPCGIEFFPSSLKILQWHRCCLDVLREELIDMKMKLSPLKQPWRGSQAFGRLKFMDLSHSRYLVKTPNFDEIPDLQNLILEGCVNLVEVHPSLGHHQNLVMVNLKGCMSIKTLPSKFEMKCLETLILSGCLKIRRLPEFGESMKCLSELDVEETGITKLPQSLVNLGQLVVLNMRNCKNLVCLPNFDEIPYLQNLIPEGCVNLVEVHPSLGHHQNLVMVNLKGCKSIKALPSKFEMKCLETLILSGCLNIRRLPEFGESMKCLSELDVEETGITKLPQSLVNLGQLVVLNLRNCKNLVCLPNVIHCLKFIKILNISSCPKLSRLPENLDENVALEELDASGTAIKEVPSSIVHLKNLRSLSFSGCSEQAQTSSPNFFSFLTRLSMLTRPSMSTGLMLPPSLLGLSNLSKLDLSYCNLSDESLPIDINGLSSLLWLNLSGNNFVSLPFGFISNLSKLNFVNFNHCQKLQSLPSLPSKLWLIREFLDVFDIWAGDCPAMKLKFDSQQLWKILEQFECERWSDTTYPCFCMRIGGSEVPSWFHNQNYFCDDAWDYQPNVSFITDMHDHHHSCKWSGIFVCLVIEGHYGASYDRDPRPSFVSWIFRNPGDKPAPYPSPHYVIDKQHHDRHQLFLLFFPCTDKRSHQISFCIENKNTEAKFEIRKCGWRVLCEQDIEAWKRTRGEGCSTSDNDSGKYLTLDELGPTEATSLSDEEDLDVDIQMPLTKRRKLQ